MSEEPFIPTSNYPRRDVESSRAKKHARAALAAGGTVEVFSVLHLVGMIVVFPLMMVDLNLTRMFLLGSAEFCILVVCQLARYATPAKWENGRVWGVALAMVIGWTLAFLLPPLGFFALGLIGVCAYNRIRCDLDSLGMSTRGIGIPKLELKRIIESDPYEVTPLE